MAEAIYRFASRAGVFRIVNRENQWHALLNAHWLAEYPSPEQAVGDISGGRLLTPLNADPASLGIPSNLSAWELQPEG